MTRRRKSSPKRPWSPEELALLVELAEDFTPKEIADILGRGRPSVRSKMRALGVSGRHDGRRAWTPEEVAFLEAHATTMTSNQMAAALDRTVYSVRKKCWAIGLDLESKRYPDEDVRLVRLLADAGLTRDVIAEKMEVPRARVGVWLRGESRASVSGGASPG